jgi:hypothetical protein
MVAVLFPSGEVCVGGVHHLLMCWLELCVEIRSGDSAHEEVIFLSLLPPRVLCVPLPFVVPSNALHLCVCAHAKSSKLVHRHVPFINVGDINLRRAYGLLSGWK